MYITPRTLLGIIRISQSVAKFHFRDQVNQNDVDQAISLMDYSLKTLSDIGKEKQNKRSKSNLFNFLGGQNQDFSDVKSKIINDVRSIFNQNEAAQMKSDEIFRKLKKLDQMKYGHRDFTKDNVDQVLLEYK